MRVCTRCPATSRPGRRRSRCRRAPGSRPSAIADLEIGRHAHRQRVDRRGPRARSASKHSRSARNCARCRAGVGRRRGDAHEAAQRAAAGSAATACASASASPGATPLLDASPLTLTCDADVERRQRRPAARRQPLGDLQRGRRSRTQSKRAAAGARLVALQRPDQVPLDVRQVGERATLGARLLHVVLAERALPERVHGAHRVGRKRLGHREQPHGAGRRGRPPLGGVRCAPSRLATPSRSGS